MSFMKNVTLEIGDHINVGKLKAEIESCRLDLLPEWETRVTEYQRTEDREAGERLVGYAECTVDYIPIGSIPRCALCEPGLRAGD